MKSIILRTHAALMGLSLGDIAFMRLPITQHGGFKPRKPSRWMPHQGARECARRRRQMARKANA